MEYCHNTTDRGWTQLESSGILGVKCGTTLSAWTAFDWPVFIILVVYARLLVVVRLYPDEGTNNWDKRRASEVL